MTDGLFTIRAHTVSGQKCLLGSLFWSVHNSWKKKTTKLFKTTLTEPVSIIKKVVNFEIRAQRFSSLWQIFMLTLLRFPFNNHLQAWKRGKNPFKYRGPTTSTVDMSGVGLCSSYCSLMKCLCNANIKRTGVLKTFQKLAGGLVAVSNMLVCMCQVICTEQKSVLHVLYPSTVQVMYMSWNQTNATTLWLISSSTYIAENKKPIKLLEIVAGIIRMDLHRTLGLCPHDDISPCTLKTAFQFLAAIISV